MGNNFERNSQPSAGTEPAVKHAPFPVIGLGASAGGLQALKDFFTHVPAESGMAFVVIMHLSPKHESHAAALLQATTEMPVMQITESVRVEPNRVYVVPPTKHLAMNDGHISLTEPEPLRGGQQVAIDLFFRTLGDTHKQKAVGIVLVNAGKTLVYVSADDNKAKRAVAIMERYSAAQSATAGRSERGRTGKEGEVALPVMEEQLQVGKREVERGGVRVHSRVTEKPVEETVTLREETVHVERRPADRAVSEADMAAMRGGTIEMTETSEEAVVSKQARVVGEVVVSKDTTERQETVRDTVRRTDVDVEQLDTNTEAKSKSTKRNG